MNTEWVQLHDIAALLERIIRRAEEEGFVYPVRLEFWDATEKFIEGKILKSESDRVSMDSKIEEESYEPADAQVVVGEPAQPIVYRLIDGRNRTISGDLVTFSKQ